MYNLEWFFYLRESYPDSNSKNTCLVYGMELMLFHADLKYMLGLEYGMYVFHAGAPMVPELCSNCASYSCALFGLVACVSTLIQN